MNYREINDDRRRKQYQKNQERTLIRLEDIDKEVAEYIEENTLDIKVLKVLEVLKEKHSDSGLVNINSFEDLDKINNNYESVSSFYEIFTRSLSSYLDGRSPLITVMSYNNEMKYFGDMAKKHRHIKHIPVKCGVKANEFLKNDLVDLMIANYDFIEDGHGTKIINSLMQSKAKLLIVPSKESSVTASYDLFSFPHYFEITPITPCSNEGYEKRKLIEDSIGNDNNIVEGVSSVKKKRIELPYNVGKVINPKEVYHRFFDSISEIYRSDEKNISNVIPSLPKLYLLSYECGLIAGKDKGKLLQRNRDLRLTNPSWLLGTSVLLDNMSYRGEISKKDKHLEQIRYIINTCPINKTSLCGEGMCDIQTDDIKRRH